MHRYTLYIIVFLAPELGINPLKKSAKNLEQSYFR